jgi:hypothetical protein
MTFFNKKEEVIDLVLTRLGREKLAVGEFRPTHYDFFDDEIVYDIKTLPSAPSIVELQNEITNRIKTVPTLKNQTGYQGSKKVTDHSTHAPFLFKSLGDSSVFNEEKPAWDVQVRQGRISGSVDFTPLEFPTSSANSLGAFSQEKIPQLDVVCEYSFTRTEFKDHPGKYQLWLRKTSDDILLEIEEENTESTDDNFIIEVFEYEKDGAGNIIDAIPLKFSEEELNTGVVEYYFDITTDADAEETLEIKYVDQPLKKTVEVDKCDSTLESSCAREKIKQLKAELSKLKSENDRLKNRCVRDSDCPSGFACMTVIGKCAKKQAHYGGYGAGKGILSYGHRCKQDTDCSSNYCKGATPTKDGNCVTKPTGKEIKEDGKCTQHADCTQKGQGPLACCDGKCVQGIDCQEKPDDA